MVTPPRHGGARGLSALCIAGGGAVVRLAVAGFMLAWSHTVEHTRWEEDWQIRPGVLHLESARVEGSGAGMEPGPGARRTGAMWEWHPRLDLPEVLLRRAPEAGQWQLCAGGQCRSLGEGLPPEADPVRLYPCG